MRAGFLLIILIGFPLIAAVAVMGPSFAALPDSWFILQSQPA